MFNFCIVIGVEIDQTPYEAVVRRLATTFTEMEIQNEYLSQEGVIGANAQGRRSIAALIEIIKEDLNNYNECMIPVGGFTRSSSSNLKLLTRDLRRCKHHQHEALPCSQTPTLRQILARPYLYREVF